MTPERLPDVRGIVEAALGQDADKRAAFIEESCHGDELLNRAVLGVLARITSLLDAVPAGAPLPPRTERRPGDSNDTIETTQFGLHAGLVFAERYEIQDELGRGGFGVVYRAFDRGPLQRLVALKLIRFGTPSDPEQGAILRQRFLKEARTAGSLSHSNIATVFDVGEWSGISYMTQELAPGRDLRKLLAESRHLPLRRVLAIARQVCKGLADAHAKGIVHRDIKPANIVLDDMDRVKITDFGLAKILEDEDSASESRVAGTPGYMAPEQLRGEPSDARADIFAVGCVLYQMLVGRPPFEGSTIASIMEKTLHSSPPDPSQVREDLPHALNRIVARALRKEPEGRYENISLLEQDLLNYEQFEYLLDRKQGANEVSTALEARQCALFLGLRLPAGLDDKPARSAEELIAEYLAEHLGGPVKAPSLSRVAQNLEMERGRQEMLRYLAAAVRNPRVSSRELIRRVARLPFPIIVTTRYDTFLEEELLKAGRKIHRILDCRNVPDSPPEGDLLVRLFGSVESEASIVVTEDDQWNFFGSFSSLADALKSIFARQRLLFLGYDPEDEGFRHLFSEISRFRTGVNEGCYLPVMDAALSAVRWAQRKGLRLIETEPGPFLSLLEEMAVEQRRQRTLGAEPVSDAPLPSRPYKFLNYYDVRDERIFFGRQSETNKVLTKIHAYALNLLYAPSGSGKTSLVCAALMPQLSRQGYCPLYVRVYDDPEGEIRRAALEAAGASASEFAGAPLESLLPQLSTRIGRRFVIFVDQFEEIFIRYSREARDRFATALQTVLAERKGQVRFVLSLREDFLARISEFRDRIPNIFHNEFRLGPLTEEESRAAIVEPAKLLGLEVEAELVDRLIADLSREGIDPPQLQIVCDTLFDHLTPGEKRLALKSYLALGGTRKILTDYLERALYELPQLERETAREILKSLVTSEQTKTVLRISDLVRAVGKPEDEVTRILSDLSTRRLIRRVQHEEGFWYELTHEYLVEEISRWLSDRERELKKIREMLEQSVRNHRNLGMLMPAAQVRLVIAHEDDLHLSKEERQLMRASEAALSTRKKRFAIAAAVAAVLVIILGIAWRYAYLSGHVFIQAQDKEYIELNSSDPVSAKQAYRLENVRVYRGSPARWWIDARLGFPKPIYETDVELDQLDPARRDAIKAGRIFSYNTPIQDAIFNMLQPDVKVRFLIASGRLEEAVKSLRALYKDTSIDQDNLDRILLMLAYCEIRDEEFIKDALHHTLLRQLSGYVPFDTRPASLAGLLGNLPRERWRAELIPLLDISASRSLALRILGLLGNKDEAFLARPYLDASFEEGVFGTVRPSALHALDSIGDCSALSAVRKLIADTQSDISSDSAALPYLRRCGVSADLGLLEALARREAKTGGLAVLFVPQILESMYLMAGGSSIPAIRSIVDVRTPTEWKLQALDYVLDPRIPPDVALALDAKQPGIRAHAAAILVRWGRADGLQAAARIILDQSQDLRMRERAFEAFQWFKGRRLRDFVLKVFRSASPQQGGIRMSALRSLRWYDDDETLSVLGQGLSDNDSSVRTAAVESLVFQGSMRVRAYLHKKIEADPITRIYAARALQFIEGFNNARLFEDYLTQYADVISDYPTLVQAVVGLRNCYLSQPAAMVVQTLCDPRRTVRLAATLALTEHPEADEVAKLLARALGDKDPWFRIAVLRARWAIQVTRKQAALRELARSALLNDDSCHASQILDRVEFANLPLKMGLSAPKSTNGPEAQTPFFKETVYAFDEVFLPRTDRLKIIQIGVDLKQGSYQTLVSRLKSLLSENPALGKSIPGELQSKHLQQLYEYRVLTGMQQPIIVDNIDLPPVPAAKRRPN